MSNSYEYKCPDCGEFVNYGDNFCKNCSCKLDWEDETNDTFKEEKKETNNSQKSRKSNKNIKNEKFKIFNLFCVVFILCFSTYGIGVYLKVYEMSFIQIIMSGILDFVVYSVSFMIFPFISFIKNKERLSIEYVKKIKINSFCVSLIISLILSPLTKGGISAFNFGYFFGLFVRMLVYSIMYFYINKWLFVDNTSKNKTSYISIVLFVILIILLLLEIIGCYSIAQYSNNENVDNNNVENNNYDLDDFISNDHEDECIFVVTEDVSKVIITANNSSGAGDVFSTTNSNLKYRIIDFKIGDTYEVVKKYNGDESRNECNENWYVIKLKNGEKGYIWGGYKGMYVDEKQ